MTAAHPEQTGTAPYRCHVCGRYPARWRLDRLSDAVVTWACDAHLVLVLTDLLPPDKHRDQARVTDLTNRWSPTTEGGEAR